MRRTLLVALVSLGSLAAGAAMAQDAPPPQMRMPTPEEAIKRLDTNTDGVVEKAEWTAAGRPEERFAMLDGDKDGKVTVDEMKAAFEKMRQRRAQGEGGPPPGPPPEGAPPQN
jgi:hypothetical protein